MKRALLISLSGHLFLLALLWLLSTSFSRPVIQGYPRTINAVLVAGGAVPAPRQVSAPAAPSPRQTQLPQVERQPRSSAPPPVSQPPEQRSDASPVPDEKEGIPGAESISLDEQDFPFPQYLGRLQYQVERWWRPPRSAEETQQCTVYFKIERSGKLLEISLESPSGNPSFDRAALQAVSSAAPFPPFPPAATLQTLGVHFEFVGRR